MAISTNQKPVIYPNLYENTDPDHNSSGSRNFIFNEFYFKKYGMWFIYGMVELNGLESWKKGQKAPCGV